LGRGSVDGEKKNAEAFDVKELVREAWRSLRRQARKKREGRGKETTGIFFTTKTVVLTQHERGRNKSSTNDPW